MLSPERGRVGSCPGLSKKKQTLCFYLDGLGQSWKWHGPLAVRTAQRERQIAVPSNQTPDERPCLSIFFSFVCLRYSKFFIHFLLLMSETNWSSFYFLSATSDLRRCGKILPCLKKMRLHKLRLPQFCQSIEILKTKKITMIYDDYPYEIETWSKYCRIPCITK